MQKGRVFRPVYASSKAAWFIAYCADDETGNAHEIKERGGSEKAAHELLATRLREVANARDGLKAFVAPKLKKLTVADLCDAVETDYTARGLRSLRQAKDHMQHAAGFSGRSSRTA
jgi:hypothetical protein